MPTPGPFRRQIKLSLSRVQSAAEPLSRTLEQIRQMRFLDPRPCRLIVQFNVYGVGALVFSAESKHSILFISPRYVSLISRSSLQAPQVFKRAGLEDENAESYSSVRGQTQNHLLMASWLIISYNRKDLSVSSTE